MLSGDVTNDAPHTSYELISLIDNVQEQLRPDHTNPPAEDSAITTQGMFFLCTYIMYVCTVFTWLNATATIRHVLLWLLLKGGVYYT